MGKIEIFHLASVGGIQTSTTCTALDTRIRSREEHHLDCSNNNDCYHLWRALCVQALALYYWAITESLLVSVLLFCKEFLSHMAPMRFNDVMCGTVLTHMSINAYDRYLCDNLGLTATISALRMS